MDPIDVPGWLGGFGALGLLVWWGVKVMRQMTEDRRDRLSERTHYAKTLAERDETIRDLRARLEAERQARWRAEDAAADYRRRLGEDAS